ncbi:MAG: NAD(P)-binding protein [Mycobacteriales bacterium]
MAVVGGAASGLTAGCRLARAGTEVMAGEPADRPGVRIGAPATRPRAAPFGGRGVSCADCPTGPCRGHRVR